jgi:hypothetical protein
MITPDWCRRMAACKAGMNRRLFAAGLPWILELRVRGIR